jgi:hypothetical protein
MEITLLLRTILALVFFNFNNCAIVGTLGDQLEEGKALRHVISQTLKDKQKEQWYMFSDQKLHFELPNEKCVKEYYQYPSAVLFPDDIYFTVLLTSYPDGFCDTSMDKTAMANQVWTLCYGGEPFPTDWLGYFQVSNPVFRYSYGEYCWVSPDMYHAWGQPQMKAAINPNFNENAYPFISKCSSICPRLPGSDLIKYDARYIGACPFIGTMFRIVIPGYPGTGCIVRIVDNIGNYCHVKDLAQLSCFGGDAKTLKFNFLPDYGNSVGDCKCP